MKQTTNYGLNKPELQDSPPDITVLNPNFDKIDAEMKRLTNKDTEIVESINKVKNDYLPKTGGNITNGLTIKNKTVAVSVNGSVADANGNITIDVGGDVRSVNGVEPDSKGNVELDLGVGDVQSVDGVQPDKEGNVNLNASTREEILKAAERVTDVNAEFASIETDKVNVSGSRGLLAGYETIGSNTVIDANAPDSNETDSAITVANGMDGTSWTKIVRVTAEVAVTLGDKWSWQNGEEPNITTGGILVCIWCGSGGIVGFLAP